MKVNTLIPSFVENMPETLADGYIYISNRHKIALHRCCCGCGEEVATPLSPVDWSVRVVNETVTLYPSIGSWNLPCQSHYWIRRNRVIWARPFSKKEIERVKARDRRDKEAYINKKNAQYNESAIALSRQEAPRRPDLLDYWNAVVDWLKGK